MASDEWVQDVRRWVMAGGHTHSTSAMRGPADDADTPDLGYEAADPTLQARHWPDASLDPVA